MAANAARDIDFAALRSLRDRHGVSLPRGRVVVREGDTTSMFYVVLCGSVQFTIRDTVTGGQIAVGVAGPGDFFGEIACFGGLPRTATATAAQDGTVLLSFGRETALELLSTSPRFALGVIQRVGDRVRETNQRLREVNEQVATLRASQPWDAGWPDAITALSAAAESAAPRRSGTACATRVSAPPFWSSGGPAEGGGEAGFGAGVGSSGTPAAAGGGADAG